LYFRSHVAEVLRHLMRVTDCHPVVRCKLSAVITDALLPVVDVLNQGGHINGLHEDAPHDGAQVFAFCSLYHFSVAANYDDRQVGASGGDVFSNLDSVWPWKLKVENHATKVALGECEESYCLSSRFRDKYINAGAFKPD
jgi:hypothetical protein